MDIYYCVLTLMDDAEHSANHTDLSRRIKLGSCLYRTLLDYMTSMNTEYVGLSVPVSDPEWYQPKCAKFVDRFPKEYVDEVEALLAQGGCVLTLNKRKSDDVSLFRVTSEKDFTRVLLSLFVQSVQQRNRHAGMLYAMVNISPSLKNSKRCVFVSETNVSSAVSGILPPRSCTKTELSLQIFVCM